MLRAFARDSGAIDVDDEYLKRQKYLQARKQTQHARENVCKLSMWLFFDGVCPFPMRTSIC